MEKKQTWVVFECVNRHVGGEVHQSKETPAKGGRNVFEMAHDTTNQGRGAQHSIENQGLARHTEQEEHRIQNRTLNIRQRGILLVAPADLLSTR